MRLFKKHNKATAEIQFGAKPTPTSQTRQWTSDDIIEGLAHFTLPPGVQHTRSTVTLRGIVSIRTNETPRGSMQPRWRNEKLKFLSVGLERQAPARSTTSVKLPFRFDMRDCRRYSTLEAGLPPSLNSGAEAKSHHKHDSYCAYDVRYTITASAHWSQGVLASTKEEISLLPVGELDPPTYGSLDVPGEQFTASTAHKHSAQLRPKRKRNHIDIAVEEPSPLTLRPDASQTVPSTTINLMVKTSFETARSLSDLPQQCSVSTRLVTNTLVSPNGKAGASARRERSDPDSQITTTKGVRQEYTLAIPQWEPYRPDSGDDSGFAIAKLSFLSRLPHGERHVPTFTTPILSRSYALDLKLSVPGTGGERLKLSMPFHVQYAPASELKCAATADGRERKDSALTLASEVPATAG